MAAAEIEDKSIDADQLRRSLRPFQTPDTSRSVFEFGLTIVLFALAWAAMAVALSYELGWLYAALILPAAGLLLRLFMVQHDCGHGSFFATRNANDWVGRIVGVLTLTDYEHWRRSHAIHHATSGNLDRRGVGDIDTLTVAEYRARSRWGRLRYRLYRNPLVMFGIGPSYVFLLQGRLPVGFMRSGRALWLSTMGTNLGIAAVAALLVWAVGPATFLMIQLPIVVLAATIGVWLFFVQHQFDGAHWRKDDDWSASHAALYGSSYYHMPAWLDWLTANIGVHHVHHLSSRIPFYNLPKVLRAFPELRDIGRVTLRQSLNCVPLSLWDEASQKLITFKEFYASAEPARA